ncbi:DUF3048 domain-containing protein [Streptomyces sp. NPDC006385]|uniref:DUF3048 domain-containing protein n=1 Tax=Streptomyces sp. NPDC006385 TaxID=3156761 RepID=UPI00339E80EE
MAGLLAVALTASLTAGCTTSDGSRDDGRGQEQPASPGERASESLANGESVLAVKLDNARAALPHTGLNAADIVYVEEVEGGLSRLMAVYAQKLPRAVGPVRSARETDLELLRQFDRPMLAYSGAQGKLKPLIDKAPLQARPAPAGKTSGTYFRWSKRPSPHNLYLRPKRLMPTAPGTDVLTTGFLFGAAPPGGKARASQTVRYPAARFTFTWSRSQDRWLVAMDGKAARTTDGKRVTAGTVIVQYVKVRPSAFHDALGNNTPYTETVGSGKARVLRDGLAYDVQWKRPRASAGTTFTTAAGKPMRFQHGQVWVVLAKAP